MKKITKQQHNEISYMIQKIKDEIEVLESFGEEDGDLYRIKISGVFFIYDRINISQDEIQYLINNRKSILKKLENELEEM